MPDISSFTGVRRLPAVYKKIENITQSDTRVRIIGRVVSIDGDVAVIDDGTGSAIIRANECELKEGNVVMAIGRVIATEDGFEVECEAIVSAEDMDVKKYAKAWDMFIEV